MTTETLQKAKELEETINQCNDFLHRLDEMEDTVFSGVRIDYPDNEFVRIPLNLRSEIIKQIIHTVEYESVMLQKELKEL